MTLQAPDAIIGNSLAGRTNLAEPEVPGTLATPWQTFYYPQAGISGFVANNIQSLQTYAVKVCSSYSVPKQCESKMRTLIERGDCAGYHPR